MCIHALLIVVLEKRVQPSAVDEYIRGIDDAEGPGLACLRRASGVCWVAEGGVHREGRCDHGVALPVRSLRLDHCHEDVLRLLQLVLVQDIVLCSGAVEPHRALGGLGQDSTTIVDGYLPKIRSVEVVVARPGPDILHVEAGGLPDVQMHEGAEAFWVSGIVLPRFFRALLGLEISAS